MSQNCLAVGMSIWELEAASGKALSINCVCIEVLSDRVKHFTLSGNTDRQLTTIHIYVGNSRLLQASTLKVNLIVLRNKKADSNGK